MCITEPETQVSADWNRPLQALRVGGGLRRHPL